MSASSAPICVALLPEESGTKGLTLSDCVPWLEIAAELIERGPSGLTIEAMERYRRNLLEIIEHIRPAVAREAERTRTH
jgi:hypothetical protein